MSAFLPKPSSSSPPLTHIRPLISLPRVSLSAPPHQHRPKSTFALSQILPSRIYDTHTHVSDPVRFPVSSGAQYRPHAAKLADLYAVYRTLGFDEPGRAVKTVLVQ